ncbi:MAG TPA: NAD(P)H-dependent oxidoreductase [Tissierellia bacterium]|nr:NAD(P)H-dependent oxidoreductase [Tissierellia bacterium]
MKKIGLIVGSLRRESYNRKLALEFMALVPDGYQAELIEISDLPVYNEDFDHGDPPQAVVDFRQKLSESEAFVFVTPEYNRSVPSGLKNAIDVGSRPPGESKWSQKPAAIISASPGAYGAFGANHHLRQSLVFLDMPTVQQPEAYLGGIDQAWEDDGTISQRTKKLLQKVMDALIQLIEKQ